LPQRTCDECGIAGGIWSVFSEAPRMMGQHLRSALGNSSSSSARVQEERRWPSVGLPLENSVEAALAKVGLPLFVLDLRGAVHDPGALAWLGERRRCARISPQSSS